MKKKLLTIGEASEHIGVSIDTLRKWDEKGLLQSFRPSPTSKRYYRTDDIEEFLKKDVEEYRENLRDLAMSWATREVPTVLPASLYCETNDIFSARLQRLSTQLGADEKLKEVFPLVVAVIGEIGNNSYNHNIGNWVDLLGIFFGYNIQRREVVVADRGRGVLATLKRVLPELKTDTEAIKVAFTKYISARAPEDRGNGLKFVRDVVSENGMSLEFFSGKARLVMEGGADNMSILESEKNFHGCVAILHY